MNVKLVDLRPLHPLLCYPGTNRPLRAVGLRADGSPLWPLLGGDGEDDGGEGEGEGSDDEDESDEDADADDTDEDGDVDGSKKKGKAKRSGPVSREDFERLQRQLSASDRRRTEAETKAAELAKFKEEQERKGKPEIENLKRDLEAITKERDSFQGRFTTLARTNAFLTASARAGIAWHDPEDAQAAAGKELRDLEIDEDGNVEGISQLVKDLAKRKKYLVKPEGKTESDDDEEGKKTRARGASGSTVGSTKTGKGNGKPKGQLTPEELRKRFPALRTR